jgi:thiol peroxidase
MAVITLKGNQINTIGNLPAVGAKAPDFLLCGTDLQDVGLAAFAGKTKILSIVPSLDTGICAMSAVRFNQDVGSLSNTVIINVSADLPFAAKRFCDGEKLTHIISLSSFRNSAFGKDYGMEIVDGPLKGLLGRAVLVLNAQNTVVYAELVPEIAQEPNYASILKAAASI